MFDQEIAASRAYLESAAARESLAADPYWPKWDSPWWHVTLLHELGRADAVPRPAAEALFEAIQAKYLRFFPSPSEPLPPGKDGARDVLCHCAIGNVVPALEACGVDVEGRAPWLRAWLLRYQLPDGGLNCDEAAHAAGGPSSVQSTVPALEAVLALRRPPRPEEERFLDRGAAYLIERRLARRRRDGRPMDPDFLRVCFPRFYDYDVLRGLSFLAGWSRRLGRRVPREAVAEDVAALRARFPDGVVRVERPGLPGVGTLRLGREGWSRGPESPFPLLEACRRPGAAQEALSRAWAAALDVLDPRE